MAITVSGTKMKKCTVNGAKCKRVTVNGVNVWTADENIKISVSVQNGRGVNQENLNHSEATYTVPKDVEQATLTAVALSQPHGTAYARVYLNGAQKAYAANAYYGGGWSVTGANVPQTWPVKAGDVIKITVDGYTNDNVWGATEYTTLDVYITISY
jgi:hypothetical protein